MCREEKRKKEREKDIMRFREEMNVFNEKIKK